MKIASWKRVGTFAAVLVLAAGGTNRAGAISLVYEDGPNLGQSFAGGHGSLTFVPR